VRDYDPEEYYRQYKYNQVHGVKYDYRQHSGKSNIYVSKHGIVYNNGQIEKKIGVYIPRIILIGINNARVKNARNIII
jgi:hypothetical protein